MAQSTVAVLQSSSPFTRSDSLASSASGASLTRRSRTRTRTLSQAKRGKNFGPSGKQRDEDGPVSVPLADVAPPVPPLCYDSPEEVDISRQMRPSDSNPSSRAAPSHEHPTVTVDKFKPDSRRISRSWSAVNVREGPGQTRGRQAKSEGGSLRGVKAVKRGISLPRQAFRSNVSSDSSSQPSPLTPHNFHDMPGVHVVGDIRGNYRDSTITQFSSTSSSLYPASTSTGSSLLPYSDDQDESMDTYPQIASPGNSEFDADDVSYRLRLLLNNSYFLPPAHTKPSPLSLAPPPILPAKRATKPANANFLDFFRIGKSKSKPVTPLTCSPPAVDVVAAAPILRTTPIRPLRQALRRGRPHAA
ncbi:hypothetical protein A0H81_07804 [Grifola frondosa]|uniref:Uncharacterized protein n=1 Tax=Grifola frondosa TaxID=5627 RepID=A0A1C7M5C3_GRIFR|nr:hypothetical protein A0H81_07804 [Grifola frondosa]